MTKILLPLLIVAAAGTAFGQTGIKHSAGLLSENGQGSFINGKPLSQVAAKNTSLSDTLYYYNNSDTLLFDSSVALKYDGISPTDSGYMFGTNSYGDDAFAEMYDFPWGQDTLVNVMGVISQWAGQLSPSSTDSITFHVWGLDPTSYQVDTNRFAWNFPGASLGDMKVAVTALHLSGNQLTTTFFDAPVNSINGNFYVGYDFHYHPDSLNGEAIGLRSTDTPLGKGMGQYQMVGTDTFVMPRNAVRESDGYWYDVYNDYGYKVNLSLVPIFRINSLTSVKGVSKSGLTLLGNSPNPAANSTNINFSLTERSGLTIQITDLNGKTLNTIEEQNLDAGSHSIPVSLGEYPSGNYIYIIRTARGAAMAGIFSVAK